MIKKLRRDCSGELFSYTFLMDHLQDYASPRGKINRMLEAYEIIRIKKGIYTFGEEYRNASINRAVLANLIYGPSYVSGLYALAQHGLIPERVETVTSMTTQKNRKFDTPFGRFEYWYLNIRRYTVGIDRIPTGGGEWCLFASPEKALTDVVARERDLTAATRLMQFLVENLRIDEGLLIQLNLERMAKIADAYGSPTVSLLHKVLGKLHG